MKIKLILEIIYKKMVAISSTLSALVLKILENQV